MNNKHFGIILFLIGIVYFAFQYWDQHRIKNSFDHVKMVDFENRTLDMKVFRGKYVLVDIFGVWCIDCTRSINGLNSLKETLGNKDWEVIGLNNDEVDKTKKYIDNHHINYKIYHLVDHYKTMGITAVPTYFVVNREGKIVFKSNEHIDWKDINNISLLKEIEKKNE